MWSSPGGFTEVAGRYAEAGVNEFTITQPSPEQYGMAERIAAEVFETPV